MHLKACKRCGESIPGKLSVHVVPQMCLIPIGGFQVPALSHSVVHLQMKKVDILAHGSAATYPLKPRRYMLVHIVINYKHPYEGSLVPRLSHARTKSVL